MHASASFAESFGSTSTTLLARARRNDPAAWTRLVQLYSPLIYYWCRKGNLQAADAADVVQDVFHAVSRSLDRFQHEAERGSFRGWLRRIAINKLRDHFRLRTNRPQAEGGTTHNALLNQQSDGSDPLDADDAPASEETWLVLQAALEVFRPDFEPKTWQAFWGVTIDQRPAAEMSAELGISVNAVYIAKARVLSRLRTELRPLLDLKQIDLGD